MFQWLQNKLSGRRIETFSSERLGEFTFRNKVGWIRQIALGMWMIELVIGSDGEEPSMGMLEAASSWIKNWHALKQRATDYIRREILEEAWAEEPDRPDPDVLIPKSIEILWDDDPQTSMIYFENPGDERAWHVTFHEQTPISFAYDH